MLGLQRKGAALRLDLPLVSLQTGPQKRAL